MRISDPRDDVEQMENGLMRRFSRNLEIVDNGGFQTIGLRFDPLYLPREVRIQKAFIQFHSIKTSSGPSYFVLRADNTAHSLPFSPFPNDLSKRQLTPIVVSWSPPSWNQPGGFHPEQQTTDITSLIQHIVDLPAWSPGNALSIIINGGGERIAQSFDSSPQTAPYLFVEYYDSLSSKTR